MPTPHSTLRNPSCITVRILTRAWTLRTGAEKSFCKEALGLSCVALGSTRNGEHRASSREQEPGRRRGHGVVMIHGRIAGKHRRWDWVLSQVLDVCETSVWQSRRSALVAAPADVCMERRKSAEVPDLRENSFLIFAWFLSLETWVQITRAQDHAG
jgi:hypothetical protein